MQGASHGQHATAEQMTARGLRLTVRSASLVRRAPFPAVSVWQWARLATRRITSGCASRRQVRRRSGSQTSHRQEHNTEHNATEQSGVHAAEKRQQRRAESAQSRPQAVVALFRDSPPVVRPVVCVAHSCSLARAFSPCLVRPCSPHWATLCSSICRRLAPSSPRAMRSDPSSRSRPRRPSMRQSPCRSEAAPDTGESSRRCEASVQHRKGSKMRDTDFAAAACGRRDRFCRSSPPHAPDCSDRCSLAVCLCCCCCGCRCPVSTRP